MEPRISIVTLGVSDLARSVDFYQNGLRFERAEIGGDEIAFFETTGTRFALYPLAEFPEELPGQGPFAPGCNTITLAHNTRRKSEVDEILQQAATAGGKLIKPAADTIWGGYSGYFADPDGYFWEIAYADSWQFNDDGSLILE